MLAARTPSPAKWALLLARWAPSLARKRAFNPRSVIICQRSFITSQKDSIPSQGAPALARERGAYDRTLPRRGGEGVGE